MYEPRISRSFVWGTKDICTEKEIVRVRRVATYAEDLYEVIELPVFGMSPSIFSHKQTALTHGYRQQRSRAR